MLVFNYIFFVCGFTVAFDKKTSWNSKSSWAFASRAIHGRNVGAHPVQIVSIFLRVTESGQQNVTVVDTGINM